jgi:hypothetical protein
MQSYSPMYLHTVVAIKQDLFQPNISHMVMPSRGVAGISSCVRLAGVNEVAKDKEGEMSTIDG